MNDSEVVTDDTYDSPDSDSLAKETVILALGAGGFLTDTYYLISFVAGFVVVVGKPPLDPPLRFSAIVLWSS